MASTLEKIKTLLSSNKEESKETKMYAEMILDDGRVLATEDEQFMIGSVVMVVGDDGETSKLSAGTYTMSDGAKLTIDDDSKIVDMGEEKEAEDVEAEKEEMQEEADVADWKGMEIRIKNLEDAVADLKADKVEASSEVAEEEVEELSDEVKEDKTEMSNEVIGDLMTQIEELKSKIVELSGEPATEGIEYNPEGSNFNSTVDLAKLSMQERTAYYINNLK